MINTKPITMVYGSPTGLLRYRVDVVIEGNEVYVHPKYRVSGIIGDFYFINEDHLPFDQCYVVIDENFKLIPLSSEEYVNYRSMWG